MCLKHEKITLPRRRKTWNYQANIASKIEGVDEHDDKEIDIENEDIEEETIVRMSSRK